MNEQQFLRACGKSYPEAIAALAHFRQLVQRQCEPVARKRTKELGKTLGVSYEGLRWKGHAYPNEPEPIAADGQYELGWRAKRAENLYLYFYVYWLREPEEDAAPLGVAITIWLGNRNRREALIKQLDQLYEDPAFDGELWEYCHCNSYVEFYLGVRESELPRVSDKLDALFVSTIRFLKSLNGISTYFKA